MLSVIVHSRAAWDYYFTGTPTTYESKDYGTRQTLSATSVYILNCLFRSINSVSNGSALYCASATCLLIESSSFFSCSTSSTYGGAIYFGNSNGQCVLCKVCGNDCYSTHSSYLDGLFYYTTVNYNSVNYSSIVRCVTERSESWHIIRFVRGKIFCPSVNMSMNKCYYRSAIVCESSSSSNSVTCSLTYCTFADNIATSHNCIWFYTTDYKHEIKSCNILRNTQGSLGSEGTICSHGILMIENSCILNNIANRIFHSTSSSYTITLSNCTVDKITNNGYLTTQNTVTKSFILGLNHISTHNCHAEYDAVGTLTPIQTLKKQICYFTCEKFFYQPQLRIFFSIFGLLIFNFVNPYASGDSMYENICPTDKISLSVIP
jgi:hypothetical protein